PGMPFSWSTASADVASIDPATGVASAVAHGTTSVTATAGSVTGSASLTVDLSTTIASVVVTPGATTLTSVGAVQQFTAEAHDAGGAIVPVSSFQWTTSAPEVAGVDATGLATAAAHGVTTIVAAVGDVSGSTTLTVSLTAQIAAVVVSPGTALLTDVGASRQFTAEARDASGAAVPVAAFDWTSSVPQVAGVNPATGLATAAGQGTTTISASAAGVSGGATLDVNLTSRIASIMVSPTAVQLTGVGATQQFTAEARDANGVLLPGVQFSWSSEATDVATIDVVTGIATAVGHGATTVSATAGSVAGTASLSVDLSSGIVLVVVTPGATTLTAVGAVQQFTAEARDANGAVVPVAAFAWSSATPDVATVDPSTGLATAAAHGATTIVAGVAGITGAADLTVDLTPSVATIVVTPANFMLTSLGATRQYNAEARDVNGAVLPGVPLSWTSSVTGVATIDPATGLANAAGPGATTIVATSGTVSGNATLVVDLTNSIVTIEVTPASATLTVLFTKQQFTAVARDANGAVLPGIVFAWSSTLPGVASIGQLNGSASALANGVTTIVATAGSASGIATLTVQVP
ncbi:MAG: beta strand repeat-containing protein, partial [Gemmatimonadaceae bacterium]